LLLLLLLLLLVLVLLLLLLLALGAVTERVQICINSTFLSKHMKSIG